MSYLLNNQQKFNDVVFEHRNKNYGAYAIRSTYGNTVFKSLLVLTLSVGTLSSIAYLLSRHADDLPALAGQLPEELVYTVDMKPPVEDRLQQRQPEPPRPTPPAAAAAVAIGTRVMDSVAVNTNTQATVEDQPAVASSVTGSANAAIAPNTGGGTGSGVVSNGTSTASAEPSELFGVEEHPEFEGGLQALYRFIGSHLRYPAPASSEGVEGTVHVRFVVDEKGKVGQIVLRNNLGYGLDDEARRVVSMIPDFKKPAKVGGRPVKVYYQLPIKFKLK